MVLFYRAGGSRTGATAELGSIYGVGARRVPTRRSLTNRVFLQSHPFSGSP